MRRLLAGSMLAAILLGGCSGDSPSPSSILQTPPPLPGSVATTAWEVAEDPPEGFGPGAAAFDSPRDLLQALLQDAASREGGLPEGLRLVAGIAAEESRSAVAWIQVIGGRDDSVAGEELELTFAGDDLGWHVDWMRFRTHCRRGADAGGHLCL